MSEPCGLDDGPAGLKARQGLLTQGRRRKEEDARGFGGAEFLWGIPGSVGGALAKNSGTKHDWIGELVREVTAINSEGIKMLLKGKDLNFGYRKSNLSEYIILDAVLELRYSRREKIQDLVEDYAKKKLASQDMLAPSAGSVFKNTPLDSAGRLVEQCGLKGRRYGDAQISERHANFIVNKGSATASQVMSLIELVKYEVYKKFGVWLELEIDVIGEDA